MPYIDRLTRRVFDNIVSDVSYIGTTKTLPEVAVDFFSLLDLYLLEKRDGIINYVFTRILKWNDNSKRGVEGKADGFIELCLNRLAFESPKESYFAYERIAGLLFLMNAEFERRGWMTGGLELWFAEKMRLWVGGVIFPYENIKMRENGDLL